MIEYPQIKHLPDEYIIKKLSQFWEEDMPSGDETTKYTIPENTQIKAEIQAVDDLVFVGKIIIFHFFRIFRNFHFEYFDLYFIVKGIKSDRTRFFEKITIFCEMDKTCPN